MTDKQIIIDGVDVSGCEFTTKAEMACDTHCRLYDYKYCIGKDCYYKQLKRKEQECEELKRELIQYEKDVKDLNYFAIKLKQTLTEIKDFLKEECLIYKENYIKYQDILRKINEVEDENL